MYVILYAMYVILYVMYVCSGLLACFYLILFLVKRIEHFNHLDMRNINALYYYSIIIVIIWMRGLDNFKTGTKETRGTEMQFLSECYESHGMQRNQTKQC